MQSGLSRKNSKTAKYECTSKVNPSESNAALARDLRILIRERLTKGDSDAEITDFIVARYGDFVLLKPRLTTRTAVLWATPFLIILVGFALILRRRTVADQNAELALTADEQAALWDISSQ